MGELYNPYPKLPKNIRQIGERDQIVKLYVEDYVNTYLKRLYPTGGRDLRVGLLLGEMRSQDGIPYLFADGALEMEGVTQEGEKVFFTEEAWKQAYQMMEQMFPRRIVLGWFLCGAPGSALSPLNYWNQHNQYFSGKHQLMYLNSGLEGEEAVYVASEDGFYKIRGYYIYYEKNQMMQDYMVSRKDAHRVETVSKDTVIQDFRQRLGEKKEQALHRKSAVSRLGTACSVLSVLVLASGVVILNNYQKMKAMESVIASVLPKEREVEVEEIPGEVYPTLAEIRIETEGAAAGTEMETEMSMSFAEQEEMSVPDAQSAQSAQAVQAAADAVHYVVKPGETLYGICMEQYNSMANMEVICSWNDLGDGSHIAAGQELLLPRE